MKDFVFAIGWARFAGDDAVCMRFSMCINILLRFFIAVAALGIHGIRTVRANDLDDGVQTSGRWEGTIRRGRNETYFAVDIANRDGRWSATCRAPNWGKQAWNCENLVVRGTDISFRISNREYGDGVFDGRLLEGRLVGHYEFSHATYDISAGRSKIIGFDGHCHTQVPALPRPYAQTAVSFRNGNLTLTGLLTTPNIAGRLPAVVLLPGSKPHHVGSQAPGNPFVSASELVDVIFADRLARNGYVVLSVNSRGVGGSGGVFLDAAISDLADDVIAAVRYLRATPSVGQVGLVGESRGGAVAPLAADRCDEIAFMVLLATPALPGDLSDLSQKRRQYQYNSQRLSQEWRKKPSRESDAYRLRADAEMADARRSAELDKIEMEKIKSGLDTKSIVHEMLSQVYGDDDQTFASVLEKQVARSNTKLNRSWLCYDIRPYLRDVRVPVLAVYGGSDVRVPADENAPEMKNALAAAKTSDVTVITIPGLTHEFVGLDPTDPWIPGDTQQSIDDKLLDTMLKWLDRQKIGSGGGKSRL